MNARLGRLALLPICACLLAIVWAVGHELAQPSGVAFSLLAPVLDGVVAAVLLGIFAVALRYLPIRPGIRTAVACCAMISLLLALNIKSAYGLHLTERSTGVLIFDRGRVTRPGLTYLLVQLGFLSLALPLARALARSGRARWGSSSTPASA